MAYIYLITNTVNNKKYVGKTEQSIQKRFFWSIVQTVKNLVPDLFTEQWLNME